MKHFALIVLLLALAVPVAAEDRQVGGDFGVLMAPGEKPTLAYAVMKDWSLQNWFGPVFERVEASFLYSDRFNGESPETYMVRGYTTHAFSFNNFYAGVGVGTWYLTNSDADDDLYAAGKAVLGYQYKNYIEGHVFGEVGRRGGKPDLYFCGAGLVIGW